jgi:hypothetical protein
MSKWYAFLFALLAFIGIFVLMYVDKILKWQGESDTIPMKTRRTTLIMFGGFLLFVGIYYLITEAFFK